MQTSQSMVLRTMVARVSPDDIVIYANRALASYLGVPKRQLIGTPLDVVSRRCKGEVSTCFARPETGRSSNHLVTDDAGRVFEAKLYSDGGVLDIVLDEVTTADSIGRELRCSSGTPFESLNEDEVRTSRHPERRYLTVSRTQIRGISQVSERQAPMEVRLMVNSFLEEACDAVFETGCTVGETSGDSVLGIFGAPRYFADHPLRAIYAACDQLQKASQLHAGLYREGKELPPCACGIWTGDTLVGTLGNSAWQHYTAIGMPVDLATKLCQLARPGEILLPEHTLTHLLRTLPESWQHVRAESEFEPDLSDFQWTGDDIAPMPEHLRKIVYLIGPGVQESTENVEFFFDYLWSLRVPGREQAVPVLRVVRPSQVGDSLELSDNNVVTNQAVQTLGKYKLIEIIGTGGMGRVWRGVDRFGNAVAIKVLHSSETVTESQLKRFRREAEVMARLPHRNICRVYEMNEFDGIQFIAMEYIDGLTLSDLLYEKTATESSGKTTDNIDLRALIHSLKSEKSKSSHAPEENGDDPPPRAKNTRVLPVEQTLSIILKVCDAVQFAHEHGVLHRDLKPGNILLREDGEPLVADFGLAKLSDAETTHSLSMTGHVVGTLENMSPEQAESSKDVDERADVYSIGTMLYQMLTGRRHFEATGNIVTDAQTLKTHAPVRPRALNPQIASDLEIITLKALRIDMAERYRSVAALQADIDHYRRGEVISARPVSALEVFKKMVQRNKGITAVIAASILIFVFGAVISIAILSAQLTKVRESEKVAVEQTKHAEEQTKLAEEEKARAEIALTQVQDEMKKRGEAEILAKSAVESRDAASLETVEERAKRDAAQKAAEEAERALAEEREGKSENAAQPLVLSELLPETKSVPEPDRPPAAAHEALMQANQLFNLEVSPFMLQQLDKNPEEVQRRLTKAMDFVTQALLASPDFFPAWMLKGRLHLALMEYPRAAESFHQAGKSAAKYPKIAAGEDAGGMAKLADQLSNETGDKYLKGAGVLQASPNPQDQNTGALLQFLADKPALRKSSTNFSGPLGRLMTPNEAAVAIMARNGPDTRVSLKVDASKRPELIVWGASEFNDLTPLKEMDPTGLTIIAAKKIDWVTILQLPQLESLDLSRCSLESLPVTQRGFLRIRSLGLAGTGISSLDFVRGMPLLAKLNVSDTNIVDVSPLQVCRGLRQFSMSGVNPANLRMLASLPLDSLTVSPMLVTDKAGLNSLRLHRTLKVLRAPGDSEHQTALEFWRKLDNGTYQTSQ